MGKDLNFITWVRNTPLLGGYLRKIKKAEQQVKEDILSQALETDEGRRALAEAFAKAVRNESENWGHRC